LESATLVKEKGNANQEAEAGREETEATREEGKRGKIDRVRSAPTGGGEIHNNKPGGQKVKKGGN
jgi:hypothetical protein